MKTLISDKHLFTEAQLQEIREMGYDFDILPDEERISPEQAAKYEVVLAFGFFRHNDLSEFTNLKMVHSYATGVDAMPSAELAARGIPLYKGKDLYSIPMAEWIICKLLEVCKQYRAMKDAQENRQWRKRSWAFGDSLFDELSTKNILSVGTGDVSFALSAMLRAFDVGEIVGVNTSGNPVNGFDRTVSSENLKDEVKNADIVVLACPHTEKTDKMINAELLKNFKKGSILVNVSRGKLVDNDAVIAALNDGTLSWYISDAFDPEPLPKDSPFWEMENVIITPHNSFITNVRGQRLSALLLKNLSAYIKGEDVDSKVDFKKGY